MENEISELEAMKASLTPKPDSSLKPEIKPEEKKVETKTEPKPEVKVAEKPVPNADDEDETELESKFTKYLENKGSQFKKFDEIENLVKEHELTKKERDALKSVPKEELDEEVKRIIDLKKSGVKFNKEYFELLNKDFDALHKENPMNSILDVMRSKEGKGLSAKALEYQIRKKYDLDKYKDVSKEELTPEMEDEIEVSKELFNRDAALALEELKKNQSEKTVFVKPTQEQITAHDKKLSDDKKAWDEQYDNIQKETSKFSVPYKIGDKEEVFEFEVSESDRKEIADELKEKNPFKPFITQDAEGKTIINHKAIFEMRLQNKLFQKAIEKAISDGTAIGASKEFSELKNTNYKAPDGKQKNEGQPKTEEEAILLAIKKQQKK